MIVLKTIMVCFAALNVLSMFSVWCLVLIQQCLAISTLPARNIPRADKKMQLYHHPLDLESQRVRLALEEEGVDYTSHHVNPITGKNLDSSFFKMNRHGRVPVFQNGSHIIYNTIDIIQYVLFFTTFMYHSILLLHEQMCIKELCFWTVMWNLKLKIPKKKQLKNWLLSKLFSSSHYSKTNSLKAEYCVCTLDNGNVLNCGCGHGFIAIFDVVRNCK